MRRQSGSIAYAAYARGEIEKMLELVDPNLEWTYLDPGLANPDPQIYYSRDELAAALPRQSENAPDFADRRRTATISSWVSHPKVDAYRVAPANDRSYDVCTIRQGKVGLP